MLVARLRCVWAVVFAFSLVATGAAARARGADSPASPRAVDPSTMPSAPTCGADDVVVWLTGLPDERPRVFFIAGQRGFSSGTGTLVCRSYALSIDAIPGRSKAALGKHKSGGGFGAVAAAPPPGQPAPESTASAVPAKRRYAVQRVFFATDRAPNADASANADAYGDSRDAKVRYGHADVSVPDIHKLGRVEVPPTILGYTFTSDPNKHMVLLEVREESLSEFNGGIRDAARRSSTREGFVFVHGYNVTWHDAVLRTAQMAHDLQIDGPAISYSWPSAGNVALYPRDVQTAAWTAPDLAAVLRDIAEETGLKKIHIVAHSLGNLALSLALIDLQRHHIELRNVHDIAMAAPDVDAAVFTQQYADAFRATAKRLTIYESRRHVALETSKQVNGGPRLGDAAAVTVVPGFDVVDATAIDTDFLGHGYFADTLPIVTDLESIFRGLDVPRPPLVAHALGSATYYAFP